MQLNVNIYQPHDSFFKKAMQDPIVARDFIMAHLPESTLSYLDCNNLELQPGLYIKNLGKQLASDVVYKTKINDEEAYLYFSIEHQSRNDQTMAFRVLRYVVEIMEKAYETSKKYPLVIPMVVYHGKSSCTMDTDVKNLIDAPQELIDQYCLQPFRLIDLTKIKDQDLAQHQHAAFMELALKSTYTGSDLFYVKKIIEIWKKCSTKGRELNLQLVLEYIFVSNRSVNRRQFLETVHKALPEDEDKTMLTIAEQFIEEGVEKGYQKAQSEMKTLAEQFIEEGREKGRREGHKEGLEEGRQQGYREGLQDLQSQLVAKGIDQELISEVMSSSLAD